VLPDGSRSRPEGTPTRSIRGRLVGRRRVAPHRSGDRLTRRLRRSKGRPAGARTVSSTIETAEKTSELFVRRLRLVAVPVLFALRRMRERPPSVRALGVGLAGAAALTGWSSVAAALSHDACLTLRSEGVADAGKRPF
jgi:hypothetical protein